MDIFHSIADLQSQDADLHLALGVFDGVHVGHQAVIQEAVKAARASGGVAGVLTFEPHPIQVLAPDRAPRRILASLDHKAELLSGLGVEVLCVQEFTLGFAKCEAADFIKQLAESCKSLKTIAVGEDWIFGKNRSGNIHTLREWGEQLGFTVCGTPPVMVNGERVSSTRIRQAIRDGNLDATGEMLGRNYTVVGTVVEGKKLARQLGFPTANVVAHNEQLPPDGVWALEVVIDGQRYQAIGNLGRRPTVEHEGARRLLEIHVFGFDGNLYGQAMEAEFIAYVRAEKQFNGIELLKAQIEADIAFVQAEVF